MSDGNRIFLEMSAIQSAVGLPKFCEGHILSRGSIYWPVWPEDTLIAWKNHWNRGLDV